jgi:hypothetical protein
LKKRRVSLFLILVFLSISVGASRVQAQSTEARYWFQVGAVAADPEATHVKGASVEINVRGQQHTADLVGDPCFWLGVVLADNSFLQVGYWIDSRDKPVWFWEYFPQSSAVWVSEAGSATIPQGWAKFTITSSNGTWLLYLNNEQIGAMKTAASDSGNNSPFALAEDASTTSTTDRIVPVEFRNLQYESSDGNWHLVKLATAYIGYGADSTTLANNLTYPYGVDFQPGRDNYWIAGSNLPNNLRAAVNGETLWPWFQIRIEAPYGYEAFDGTGQPVGSNASIQWYAYGSGLTLAISQSPIVGEGKRAVFLGWQTNTTGSFELETMMNIHSVLLCVGYFKVDQPLHLSAIYRTEYELTLTSTLKQAHPNGWGWYDDGTKAAFNLASTTSLFDDTWLGMLGAKWKFDGWYENGQLVTSSPSSSTIMDKPHALEARWSPDYTEPYLILLGLAVTVFALSLSCIRLRRPTQEGILPLRPE